MGPLSMEDMIKLLLEAVTKNSEMLEKLLKGAK